jgi:hypothetical protein
MHHFPLPSGEGETRSMPLLNGCQGEVSVTINVRCCKEVELHKPSPLLQFKTSQELGALEDFLSFLLKFKDFNDSAAG